MKYNIEKSELIDKTKITEERVIPINVTRDGVKSKVYVPETYNSADDVDIIYHKIVEKAKEKIGKDIDIDPDDYFFKFDKWIDSGILKAYGEILNCKIKIDNGYVRKMTEEEWYDFLKDIDAV